MILAAVVGLLFTQTPVAPPVARLDEIVLEGVTAFTREKALAGIRLHPGGRFFRDPAEVGESLQVFYELSGYVAPRVAARFDSEIGRLTLTVDEGRLHSIVLEGVSGDEEARVRAMLALNTGVPLQDKAIGEAIGRLETSSGGAYTVERGMYWTIDHGPTGPVLRLRVIRRRFRLTPLLSGPDASPFHNRVDGTAPGLGVEVTVLGGAGLNHASVYGRAAYAFSADAWRYATGVRRSFGARNLVTIGYERHDLTDTDDLFRRRLITGPRERPIPFHVVDDYFRRRGDEAYVFVRPTPQMHFGASFRSDTHGSLPVVADDSILAFSRRPRPNPAVGEGLMRSLLFTGRWSHRAPLFPSWELERDAFLLRSPYGTPFEHAQGARVETTYEVASDALGGDFSFQRLTGNARATRALGVRQTVTARVITGLTRGAPPLQRRFALGGLGTLRGYGLKEFAGSNAVLATAEWMTGTRPRLPSLIFFYDGGSAWGGAGEGSGWKSDAGAGLEWRILSRGWARVDVAFPFSPTPGADRARVYGMVRLPF